MRIPRISFVLFFVIQILGCGDSRDILRAKESVLRENLTRLREVLDQYYSDKGKYPPTLNELVKDGYLKKVPIDPITGRDDTWLLVYESLNSHDQNLLPGIMDIQSGAKGDDLNGTPYKEL